MWSNPAFLFLQELLVHKQLSLITKTSLRGLDDSQVRGHPRAEIETHTHETLGWVRVASSSQNLYTYPHPSGQVPNRVSGLRVKIVIPICEYKVHKGPYGLGL
jgi:hypothetical protein